MYRYGIVLTIIKKCYNGFIVFLEIRMHVRLRENKAALLYFVVACKRFAGKKNPQPVLVKSFGSSSDPKNCGT